MPAIMTKTKKENMIKDDNSSSNCENNNPSKRQSKKISLDSERTKKAHNRLVEKIRKDQIRNNQINSMNELLKLIYHIEDDIETIISNHKAFTRPRKNKNGIEMTPLEQELHNIELGFKEKVRYDPKIHGNAIDFYLSEYGEFHEAGLITQKNLSHIDKRLVENIRSYFKNKVSQSTRKKNTRNYSKLSELLPSSAKVK